MKLWLPRWLAWAWDSDVGYSFRNSPMALAAAAVALVCVFCTVFAGWVAPHNPFDLASLQLSDARLPPSWIAGGDARFVLGTDDQGRDVLARLIYGFRISVLFGLILTILSAIIGVAAGAVQGYFGGKTDLFMQRVLEVWSGIPTLIVLIIMSSVLEPGFFVLLGILLLFEWTGLVPLVRAEFLRGRNLEYVMAARALGLSNTKIMFKHILPNATVATLTFLPFMLSSAITALTSLDFLGLGLPAGSPSLGELTAQAYGNIHATWLGVTAFVAIALLLSLLIFIGEAVRDAFDPRKTFARSGT